VHDNGCVRRPLRIRMRSHHAERALPRSRGPGAPRLLTLAQSGSAPVFGLEPSFVMTSSMLDVH
jgi:hypothetical protein